MNHTLLVIVNETLIQAAVLRALPETLECHRGLFRCVATARKLVRSPGMETQRQQVRECALFCEEKLAASLESGRIEDLQYPEPGMQYGHFVLTMKW